MPKDQHILLRVDAAEKKLIAAAARRSGMSMTSFILSATMALVHYKQRQARESVAEFFCRHLATAKQGGGTRPRGRWRTGEGERGYRLLGLQLVEHLAARREWGKRVDQLSAARERREISEWMAAHLPECWTEVPYRRRAEFVRGIRAGVRSRPGRRSQTAGPSRVE